MGIPKLSMKNRSPLLLLTIFSLGAATILLNTGTTWAACPALPTDKGTITLSASAPVTGTYYIWSRNKLTTAGSGAYYLQVNNDCGNLVGNAALPANTWTWVNYKDGNTGSRMSVSLSKATHTFKLYGVSPNLSVDRIVLTTDAACVPNGTGDNCINTATTTTPPPSTAPPTPQVISPTTPSSTPIPVTGTVAVGSGKPNSKTTVKVDGKVVAQGAGTATLDTNSLPDGYHDIVIETTDENGNTEVVVQKVLVDNHQGFFERAYASVNQIFGGRRWLTLAFVATFAIMTVATLGLALYLAWASRIWQKIPIFNRLFKRRATNSDTAVAADFTVRTKFQELMGKPVPRALFIISVALIGAITLRFGFAAVTGFAVDPEKGTLAGVSAVSDNAAAGKSSIRFGVGSCPAGQTGTPPNCVTPPPPTCPAGQTGTPPNCVTPNSAKIVWSDEFDGPAGSDVNAAHWDTVVGPTIGGRLEYVTPATRNKKLDGAGKLVVTPKRESYCGAEGTCRDYTSARIEGRRPVTTGYMEFRAKVTTWAGTCPGLWFMGAKGNTYPTYSHYSNENSFIEIDMPEVQTGGTNADPTNARLTIHGDFDHDRSYNNLWQLGWGSNRYNFAPKRPGDDWHTYGAYVNPSDKSVTFYVDGRAHVRYTQAQAQGFGSDARWPYGTKPMVPVIEVNLGFYSGPPVTSQSSDTMTVDYLRYYDKPPY